MTHRNNMAMDRHVKMATDRAIAAFDELQTARASVAPVVGDAALAGTTSAAQVYGIGLSYLGVETAGVHDDGLVAVWNVARTRPSTRLASDSSGIAAFKASIGDDRSIRNLG